MSIPTNNPGKTPITNSQDQQRDAESETNGGPQGVDKAPGEDPPGKPGTDNKNELKGKKIDGDPTDTRDQPVGEEK